MRSWITNEWRLKLLSLGLAVLVLGAVAFSQNPPTTRPIRIPLSYTVPPNIVLINPPSQTTVTISGLADVIQKADSSNIIASVDATRALPGSAVKLNIQAKSLIQNVGIQQQPAPIAVTVDTYQTVTLPVQVNARAAPGWNLDPSKTVATCTTASVAANRNPCKVVFSGPVSWEINLKAVAVLQGNALGVQDALNQSVTLLNANGQLDLSVRTVPATTVDVTSVDIHTEAVQGTTSAPVALLDSPPSNPPPQGYRVTAVTITPLIVTITGDPGVIQRVRTIVLPPVDLSSSTSDATFQVAIPYPAGVSGSVANATVKYSISRNPNVSPSP
jgi:YbbR domain-containing protein